MFRPGCPFLGGVKAPFKRDQTFYSPSVFFLLGECSGLLVICEEVDVFDFKGCNLRQSCGDDVVEDEEDAAPGVCPV